LKLLQCGKTLAGLPVQAGHAKGVGTPLQVLDGKEAPDLPQARKRRYEAIQGDTTSFGGQNGQFLEPAGTQKCQKKQAFRPCPQKDQNGVKPGDSGRNLL
jgi:hypothetical protein